MPENKTQNLFHHGTDYGMLARLEYPAGMFGPKDATFCIRNMLGQLCERIYDAFEPGRPYIATVSLPVRRAGQTEDVKFDLRVDVPKMREAKDMPDTEDWEVPADQYTDGTLTLESWLGPMSWRIEDWPSISLMLKAAPDDNAAMPVHDATPTNATVGDVIRKYGIKRDVVEMELDTRENYPGEFYCMSLMEFSSEDIRDWLERN